MILIKKKQNIKHASSFYSGSKVISKFNFGSKKYRSLDGVLFTTKYGEEIQILDAFKMIYRLSETKKNLEPEDKYEIMIIESMDLKTKVTSILEKRALLYRGKITIGNEF